MPQVGAAAPPSADSQIEENIMQLKNTLRKCFVAGIAGCFTSTVCGQGLDFFWSPSGQLPNSGAWSSPGHWGMTDIFPGSTGPDDTAEIGFFAGEPYTVTLDVNPTIDLFRLISPNATFSANNRTFTVRDKSFINEGHVEWTNSTWTKGAGGPKHPSLTITADGTMRIRGNSLIDMFTFRVFGELTIEGGGGSNPATLTSTNSLENEIPGSIILTATSSASSVLQVNSGKLFNEGVVELRNPLNVQRTRHVRADVDNHGTFDVRDNAIAHFDQTGSVFTNHGLLRIEEDAELNFPSGRTLTHVDGLIQIVGALKLNNATFNFDGGWVWLTGNPVEMTNSTLNIGPGSGGGEFLLRGTTTFSGNVINEHTLTVEAGGGSNPSTLLSADGFSSLGVINLISTSSAVSMLEITNGTLSNWGHLLLRNPNGTQRTRHLRAHVDNYWSLFIEDDVIAHFDRNNGVYTNHGLMFIDPDAEVHVPNGRTLSQVDGTLWNDGLIALNSATFNYDGGVFTGNAMRLSGNSTLNIAPEAGGGSFLVLGTTTLDGDLADDHEVTVQAGGGSNPATLRSTSSFENDGTINLITTSSAGAMLEITDGTLSNHGILNVHNPQSAQTWRSLRTHLENFGTIDIADNVVTHFDRNDGVYTNHGLIRIEPQAQVNIPSGRTLTNEAAGTLAFEMASASDFARITGSGNIFLDGQLAIALIGDWLPDPGDSFTILAASSINGFFSNAPPDKNDIGLVSFPGGTFNVTYNPNSIVLTGFVHQPCDNPADLNCDGVVNVSDLLILFDQWGGCTDCGNCPADLNGDCVVNVSDLLILFDNWG
jgi:hypothetical protein